jgi:hypothetical protein
VVPEQAAVKSLIHWSSMFFWNVEPAPVSVPAVQLPVALALAVPDGCPPASVLSSLPQALVASAAATSRAAERPYHPSFAMLSSYDGVVVADGTEPRQREMDAMVNAE